jgi:hypothetical protein
VDKRACVRQKLCTVLPREYKQFVLTSAAAAAAAAAADVIAKTCRRRPIDTILSLSSFSPDGIKSGRQRSRRQYTQTDRRMYMGICRLVKSDRTSRAIKLKLHGPTIVPLLHQSRFVLETPNYWHGM